MASTESPSLELTSDQLRKSVGTDTFDFETTEELEPALETVGQDRALEAIEVGLDMATPGFNVFASGPVGTGRNSTIRASVEQRAKQQSTPSDWCYVNNFEDDDRPKALELPSGKARQLADDMEELIRDCREEIPKAFEAEEHARQKNQAMQKLNERQAAKRGEYHVDIGY